MKKLFFTHNGIKFEANHLIGKMARLNQETATKHTSVTNDFIIEEIEYSELRERFEAKVKGSINLVPVEGLQLIRFEQNDDLTFSKEINEISFEIVNEEITEEVVVPKTNQTVQQKLNAAKYYVNRFENITSEETKLKVMINLVNTNLGSAVAAMVANLADERPADWTQEFGKLYFEFSDIRRRFNLKGQQGVTATRRLYEIAETMFTKHF